MATDAEIRAAGLYAVPQSRFLQNEFQLPTNTPTETEEVTESFGIPYTNAFTNSGQSGGGMGGGGKFGNQDMSDMKEFTMDGPDGKVTKGFKNTSTGMYQDIDGLNIQNLGIKAQPLFAKALGAIGFDMDDDDPPKYPGFFTKNKINNLTIGSFKNFFDRQDKAKQDALQKEIDVANKAAAQSAQLSKEGREKYTGPGQAFEARTDTFTGGKTVDSPSTPGGKYGSPKKDGGRIGYFFGGRVNYKAGGRTDAGANRSTASKAGVGQINEAGNKVDGGNYNSGNDGGTKPTFYSPPNKTETLYENTILGKVPVGLTKNMNIGRLSGILNAKKSLEEEDLEGKLQYDSSIGPINTTMSYDTTTGPEFNANYTRNNLNTNFNSKKGLGFNYSKDIGPGKFTAGGSYGSDGTFNTEAKYGITFANGGLASIL